MMLFYFLSSIIALLTLIIVEHPWLMTYYGLCIVFATAFVLLAYCVRYNSSYPQSQDLTADNKSSSHKNQLNSQDKTQQLKQKMPLQTRDKHQDDHIYLEDVRAARTISKAIRRMEQERLKTVVEMDNNRVSLYADACSQMSEDSKDAHSMENTLLPDCSVYDNQGITTAFFQAPNGRWNGTREKKEEEQEYSETKIRLIEEKEVARLEKVRKDDAKKTKLIRKTLIPGCDPKAIAHLGDELLPSKAAFSLSQEAKEIL